MRWLRLLILACLLSNTCEAAITVDTTSSESNNCNGSFSITTSAGSNKALVVVASDNGGTLTSMTDDNGFLTLAVLDAGSEHTYIYYSTGAAVGVHNITPHYSSCTSLRQHAAAVSLFGVDQTNPVDVSGSAHGSFANPSKAVTINNANGFEVDVVATFNNTVTDNTPHTVMIYDDILVGNVYGSSGYVLPASAGTFTAKYTYSNSPNIWSMCVVVMKAAAGAAAPAASAPFFGAEF